MATASVYTYLPGFKTGSALSYPVVMKTGGLNVDDFIIQMEVKDSTELAIGDICMVATTTITIDATGAKDFGAIFVVLDTPRNKAILESHGLTVSKAVQFTTGDKIDVLILVPGMVLSLKYNDAAADLDIGDKIRADSAGQVTKLAAIATDADPQCTIGVTLTAVDYTDEATDGYIAVLITH